MGYIESGHGAKGRRIWLCDDGDIEKMYSEHNKKKKIMLWCYTGPSSKKRETVPPKSGKMEDAPVRKSIYDSQLEVTKEVDGICQDLKERHGRVFSPEQLRTWAQMLHVGTHDSYEEPPDKPFFRSAQRKRRQAEESCSTPDRKKLAVSHSPGKRVNMRSELIDQLKKCSDLVEMGAISQDVFRDLQDTILSDIKHL